jgi:hypothetical protein
MLIRLGVVLWWLGSICLIMVILFAGYNAINIYNCKSTLSYFDKISQEDNAILNKQSSINTDPKKIGAFDQILLDLQQPDDPRLSTEFLDKVEICKNSSKSVQQIFVLLLISTAITIVLWMLCYILTGSFWQPPKLVKRDT